MGKSKINELKISYDKDADTFYLSLGSPKRAVCETLDNGVVIRRDSKSNKIVGLTVIDFEKHFSKYKPHPLDTHLSAKFQLA
ncbi:MAG: DUF2283 domain-containing protein [Candidatus Omnitrophica bacterium]|nr:DUF2283 domain-containing protein [Candidatus Omnitrophota bacterium]